MNTRFPFGRRLAQLALLTMVACRPSAAATADSALLKKHCGKCHGGDSPAGDLDIATLVTAPTRDTINTWITALDFVKSGDMPPKDKNQLTPAERERLVQFLRNAIQQHAAQTTDDDADPLRRLNNRELARSVAAALLIEDVGTHQPMARLLGDTLKDGFDTNAEALGMSEFHLEQYIEAFRNVIDATILAGEQPPSQRYDFTPLQMQMTSRAQNSRREKKNANAEFIDFLDPRSRLYFPSLASIPYSGYYQITIRAAGIDRGIYSAEQTGIYPEDPIRLRVHLGDRVRTFDLLDNQVTMITLDEWLAAGTRVELSYPTDGLRMLGNGNFKFQHRITHDYLKIHDPQKYDWVLKNVVPNAPRRIKSPAHWSHWVDYWRGARPRVYSVTIEGPRYQHWPPSRQIALIGESPRPRQAARTLLPLAQRAWRRRVSPRELQPIAELVESRAAELGTVEAYKEGILALLMSPSFLMVNQEDLDAADRMATKLSLLLQSSIPDERLRSLAHSGQLNSFSQVRRELERQIRAGEADEFLRVFPYQWLQLDRINFMAPDPDRYPLYDRKRISEDMVNEVLAFFRYEVTHNRPVPELLTADFSFINADLAKIYGVQDVPQDSQLRRYTFRDGRRGGFLGMGAFLTLTADSLGTSPIHRAVYVMENYLGIRPPPPPANVKISEPDVRQAKTIKDILAAHRSEKVCASCHRIIDPFGYAFENFDPVGAWRDTYTEHIAPRPPRSELERVLSENQRRRAEGLPTLPTPWENKPIPVDASATFPSGAQYRDITEFRQLMRTPANQERFVKCFVTKLLTYANGKEPEDFAEIERIVQQAAEHDYRMLDTIAAVLHSRLFRGTSSE